MISQTPIMVEDEVVYLLIGEHGLNLLSPDDIKLIRYPSDAYVPMSLPIIGRYNDSGFLKNYEEEYFDTLRQLCRPIGPDSNIPDERFSHELFMHRMESVGRIYSRQSPKVFPVMIDKNIFDYMINNHDFDSEHTPIDERYSYFANEKVVTNILTRIHTAYGRSHPEDMIDEIVEFLINCDQYGGPIKTPVAGFARFNIKHGMQLALRHAIVSIKEDDPDSFIKVARKYVELMRLICSMEDLRRYFMLTGGKGSQTLDLVHHVNIMDIASGRLKHHHSEVFDDH